MNKYLKVLTLFIFLICITPVLAETGLKEVQNNPEVVTGGKIKIIGVFINDEIAPVDAKLTVEVYYNKRLMDVLISDEIAIPPSAETDLNIYYTPMFDGEYSLKVYSTHDHTVSDVQDKTFIATSQGPVAMGSIESIIILSGICIFAVVLHRKFSKSHPEKTVV